MQVFFHPLDASQRGIPRGVTDAEGRFQLRTYHDGDGAPAGEYTVTVYWPDVRPKVSADDQLPPDRLDERFANPKNSSLRATVAAPHHAPPVRHQVGAGLDRLRGTALADETRSHPKRGHHAKQRFFSRSSSFWPPLACDLPRPCLRGEAASSDAERMAALRRRRRPDGEEDSPCRCMPANTIVPTALCRSLIDAGKARSVFVEYADGTLERAQLVDPGMLNAAWRGTGKKELHFATPKMAKGETARVVAALSERPVEGRTYVWSGEPRQNRRVSCGQCHQGLSMPTGDELRQERKIMEETGKPPPLDLPRILPTSKGRDSRWHEKLGRYQTSACWECHARHMVQYEFGQSLERDLPWAPDPPHRSGATKPPTVQSVFYTVFRVREGRAVSHPLSSGDAPPDRPSNWEIHYGFERATVGGRPCSDILQEHAGILSEEAGKFIGRHCVLIDWVGNAEGKKKAIAREERQLTVKDWRGRNKSYAMWIDFVSTLKPAAGAMRLDGGGSPAGFRFVPTLDEGAAAEYRESAHWRAITFVSEGTTYTAACFNHPGNPKPLAEEAAGRPGIASTAGPGQGVGYSFSAGVRPAIPFSCITVYGSKAAGCLRRKSNPCRTTFSNPVKIASP